MAAKRTDVTDADRAAMVAEAQRLVDGGSTVNKALQAAGQIHHVSAAYVRRAALAAGVELTLKQSNPQVQAAQEARRAYGLEDLRALQHQTMSVVEAAVEGILAASRDAEGKFDPQRAVGLLPELGRATTVLKRLAEFDERLDRRGAPQDAPPNPQEAETALAAEAEEAERSWQVLRGGRA